MLRIALVAAVLAAVLAVTATAGATTDPRKCGFNTPGTTDHARQCAGDTAKLAARRYLQRMSGQRYLWQGPMTCTSAGSLLHWHCTYSSQLSVGTGYVNVLYRALSAGWTVRLNLVKQA